MQPCARARIKKQEILKKKKTLAPTSFGYPNVTILRLLGEKFEFDLIYARSYTVYIF